MRSLAWLGLIGAMAYFWNVEAAAWTACTWAGLRLVGVILLWGLTRIHSTTRNRVAILGLSERMSARPWFSFVAILIAGFLLAICGDWSSAVFFLGLNIVVEICLSLIHDEMEDLIDDLSERGNP